MTCHDGTVHHPPAGAALLRPHRPRPGRAAHLRAPRARRARGARRLRGTPRPCSSSAAGPGGSPPDCCAKPCRAARPTSGSTSARTWWSSRGAAVAPWAGRARIELTDGGVHFPVEDASCDRVVSTYVLDLLSPADAARVRRGGAPGAAARGAARPGEPRPGPHGAGAPRHPPLAGRLEPEPRPARRLPPARAAPLLDPADWDTLAGFTVTDWFLSSDVLVARLR